jgi:hypothetical protein
MSVQGKAVFGKMHHALLHAFLHSGPPASNAFAGRPGRVDFQYDSIKAHAWASTAAWCFITANDATTIDET